ncbi:MAG: hypothetical protein IPP31_10415 [Chitinophagaceae bacterium]|nr:hypothetical protein [Chitinophagaceae bacterium]
MKDEIREYKLQETFKLYKDYRGEENGIGALFIIDTIREGLLKNRVDVEALDFDNEVELEVDSEPEVSSAIPQTIVSTESETTVILSESQLTNEIISVMQTLPQQEGWVFLGAIGGKLKNKFPLFNQRHYGCSTLRQLFIKLNAFDMKEIGDGTAKAIYVRIKGEPSVNKVLDPKPQSIEPLDEKSEMLLYLSSIIIELSEPDGWTHLSTVGHRIKADFPDFDFQKYKSYNLLNFCESSGMFETKRTGFGPYKPVLIKLKSDNSQGTSENQPSIIQKDIIVSTLIQIVSRKCLNQEWAILTQIGWDFEIKVSDFKSHQYGLPSLRHFVESTDKFIIKQEGEGERAVLYVKLKS